MMKYVSFAIQTDIYNIYVHMYIRYASYDPLNENLFNFAYITAELKSDAKDIVDFSRFHDALLTQNLGYQVLCLMNNRAK